MPILFYLLIILFDGSACYFVCIFLIFFKKTYVFFPSFRFFFFFFSFSLFDVVVLFFDLDPPLFSPYLSLLSLSYLGICLMVPPPPQFPPPPLFFEICSFVSGGTRWMVEEEEEAYNP